MRTADVTRKEFLKGAAALAGFSAFGGRPVFAAPQDWKPKKKPKLVFGVVSDTHLRTQYGGKKFYEHNGVKMDNAALKLLFQYYKRANVDAVLHCGDVTDCGLIREMEFYKQTWDEVFDGKVKPVSMIATGNHDVDCEGGAMPINLSRSLAKSFDPEVCKTVRLRFHLKESMERIWGEPYEDSWHKTVKGYHFFGFGWKNASDTAREYHGKIYHDSPMEGKKCGLDAQKGLWMAELVRREREAGRLDPMTPFFVANHCAMDSLDRYTKPGIIHASVAAGLGVPPGQSCNGLGFFGHGHRSLADCKFYWFPNACFPSVQCSTLAAWKSHGGEGWCPLFAKGFGNGKVVNNDEVDHANHALLVRVYDNAVVLHRVWVSARPDPVCASLGHSFVLPLNWGAGSEAQAGKGARAMERHPLRPENLGKTIGSPEFPPKAKLEVSLDRVDKVAAAKSSAPGQKNPADPANPVQSESVLRIRIPKADGNPKSRMYGYNIVVAGEDGTKVRKNSYARGYCMGEGHEPNNGVTQVSIPQSELPAGKRLSIAVRPCSALASRGKPLTTTWRA